MRTLQGRYGPAYTTLTAPSPRNAHARPKTGRGPIGTCWKFGWVWCGHEVSTEIVLDNTFEAQPSNKNAPGPLWPRMYHSDCAQPAQCPGQAKDWPRPDWNMLEVGWVWDQVRIPPRFGVGMFSHGNGRQADACASLA